MNTFRNKVQLKYDINEYEFANVMAIVNSINIKHSNIFIFKWKMFYNMFDLK